MRRYRGEAAKDHFYQDFWTKDAKWAIWYAAEEEQRGMIEKLCNDQLPTYLAQFEKFLSQSDDKFITGNEFTVYDLFVGGFFVNSFMNPNANHADIVLAAMEKGSRESKEIHQSHKINFCQSKIQIGQMDIPWENSTICIENATCKFENSSKLSHEDDVITPVPQMPRTCPEIKDYPE